MIARNEHRQYLHVRRKTLNLIWRLQ